MAKEWDRANMKTLGVNLKKEEAEAFQAYAKEQGTTVGALLRGFIQYTLESEKSGEAGTGPKTGGVPHVLTYKNTDYLKHETAFHNPRGLNPDGVLNDILDDYFRFVRKVRK